jgi:hypothetical protein
MNWGQGECERGAVLFKTGVLFTCRFVEELPSTYSRIDLNHASRYKRYPIQV